MQDHGRRRWHRAACRNPCSPIPNRISGGFPMLKGFKDFVLRGNIIELSIAVVVGTAFTALVAAFTTNIVNPIIAAAGGVNAEGLGFAIWADNPKTFVNFGAVITAFITFLITAAVVYFIFVAPMNKINELVQSRAAIDE